MALASAASGRQLGQVVAWIGDMAGIRACTGKGRGMDGWDDEQHGALLRFGLSREGSGVGDGRRGRVFSGRERETWVRARRGPLLG